mmetsp:Transcript_114642/g.286580  ORF Transcript_114642/g.286580 Transcript_114642/m.286580 type:complete len:290 (+) Transcript_114642:32-901(+)
MQWGTPTVVGAPVETGVRYGKPGKAAADDDVELGAPPSQNHVDHGSSPAGASWKVPEEEWYATRCPDAMTGENRANFIRKVFGILAFQMAITVTICAAAMFIPFVQAAFIRLLVSPGASFMIMIPAICVLCALQKYKSEHPTNYYLLLAFTVLMSMSVAGVCALYQKAGLGFLILQAFVATAIAFGSLSLYALKSGKDFTWMGGMLSMALMGMIGFSFFGALFGFHGGAIFSLFGVVVFSGFILYDTSRVLQVYGPDDAIVAAVELYLDILNLFLYILELLSECSNQDS